MLTEAEFKELFLFYCKANGLGVSNGSIVHEHDGQKFLIDLQVYDLTGVEDE